MTDLRKAAEMALDAMLSEYSTGGENKYSPWDVIEALRQALAQPEQPMSPEHLPRYVATNGVKPMEGGGGGGSQPEPDWTTDTPIPPFKYLDLPEYKTTQPEQEPVAWLVSDAQGRYATIRDPAPYGEEVYEPLYTAPPKREWVGLTDEERVKCYETTGHYQTLRPQDSFAVLALARAIEAALRSKNT